MTKIKYIKILFSIIFSSYCYADVSVSVNSFTEWAIGQSVYCDINSRQGQLSVGNQMLGQGDEFETGALKPFWSQSLCTLSSVVSEKMRILTVPNVPSAGVIYGIYSLPIYCQANMTFETLMDSQVGTIGLGGFYITTGSNYFEIVIKNGNAYYILSGSNAIFAGTIGTASGTAIQGGVTYLKISKLENIFTAFYKKNSSDSWLPIGSATLPSSPIISVGLGLFNTHSYYGPATSDYEYMRMTPYSQTGTWTSDARYLSGTPTTQGTISWLQDTPAGTNISIQSSTSNDGNNWSPWSLPYGDSFGSVISSPARQFIRVAATLTSDSSQTMTPVLREINIRYPDASPQAPLLSSTSHARNAWSNNPNLMLQWSMPVGNPAPESAYTYWMYANNAVAESATVQVSQASVGTVHMRSVTLTAEGIYQVNLTVTADAFSGGLTASAAPFNFSFDRTPPGVTVITSSTHPELLFANNNSPVFSLAATDAMSGVSGFAASLDKLNYGDPGALINVWENEKRYLNVENGTYYFHARAVDAAGNTGVVSHYGIRVDFNGALLSDAYVKVLPNPVRGAVAKVEYQLAAAASEVTLEFMGGTGELILRADGAREIGKNYYRWDVSKVANGVYFYRIKAKSTEDAKTYSVTKKIAIIR